ncbi:MAG: DUF7523 family protein [Candidatus Odinarchaeia archaeon]
MSKREGLSVAEATRRVVSNRPAIIDCMKLGVLNYSALAEFVKDEVCKILNKKHANIDAIKMALMRYAEEIKTSWRLLEDQIREIISESILELKNDLAVLTVKQEPLLRKLTELTQIVKNFRFFQLTQGTAAFTLIIDQNSLSKVTETLGEANILDIMYDQSAIILISKPEIIITPGVVAYLTDLLAMNNVNITQIISCHMDTVLIVRREDALRAYKILEEKILSLRRK